MDTMIWDGGEWHRMDPPPPRSQQTNKLGGNRRMLHFTANVRWKDPAQAMGYALRVVETVFAYAGYDTWITSANDSGHKTGSHHYRDLAYDFRTKHVDKAHTKHEIVSEIRGLLSPTFDVLFEDEGGANEHLHIEYDPKG